MGSTGICLTYPIRKVSPKRFWGIGATEGSEVECIAFCVDVYTTFYYRFLSVPLFTRRRGISAARACFVPRIAISSVCRAHRIHSATPLRLFSGRTLGGLRTLRISSTIGRFTNIAMGSCKNVKNLGAISVHDLKTRRAIMNCSKVTVASYRAKRVSVNHFSLSGMSRLSLDGKRDSGVFRPTHFFTSTKVLSVRALAPHFRGKGQAGVDTTFGANS